MKELRIRRPLARYLKKQTSRKQIRKDVEKGKRGKVSKQRYRHEYGKSNKRKIMKFFPAEIPLPPRGEKGIWG